jgi:hypothetical protein
MHNMTIKRLLTTKKYSVTSSVNTEKRTNTNNSTKFRLSARSLFLTYSQIPKFTTKEFILENLSSKQLNIDSYIIALENHADGNLHAHVYLENKSKFSIRNSDFLNLLIENKIYHGNYQAVRSKKAVFQYITKTDDAVLTNMCLRNGRLLKPEEILLENSRTLGITQALIKFQEEYPSEAMKRITHYKKNLETIHSLSNLPTKAIEFPIESFHIPSRVVK